MSPTNILRSVGHESEATKARLPYAVKKYATDGESIPLKKNWLETLCLLPASYDKCLDEILSLQVGDDDVFVVTFMKSGTTWMQESVWLLLNNLDFEEAKKEAVMIRSPYLEFQAFASDAVGPAEIIKTVPSPRLLKAHVPANLLPVQVWQKQQKTIYVARNVKDVIVSSYHFLKSLNLWQGNDLAEYVEDFINNDIIFDHYWSHVVDFWRMRHESFICFVTYEEMQQDLSAVLLRLCKFLERPALTKEEMEKLLAHLSFNNMKKHKNTNLTYLLKESLPDVKDDFQFMRRGIVGSFKDELTADLTAKIDKWSADYLDQYNLKEEDIFGKI